MRLTWIPAIVLFCLAATALAIEMKGNIKVSGNFNMKNSTQDVSDWFEFYFTEDPNNSGPFLGIPMSEIDASGNLDAPAGKHGFIHVTTTNFYFEDGTRAKFWGTHLVHSANFPSHAQTDILANRLAFFGFNAVRLHLMDSGFDTGGYGIFEDINPGAATYWEKYTTKVSTTQLEKLDYLIYKLKERGIYVNMNLLNARQFTEGDGVTSASQLGIAARPFSIFDSTMIALQKQYASQIFLHKNQYTGSIYSTEPAVAFTEINNESSMQNISTISFPAFYKGVYDFHFTTWAINKYGGLSEATTSWAPGPNIFQWNDPWTMALTGTGNGTFVAIDSGARINVTAIDGIEWHVQYSSSGFALDGSDRENEYILQFRAHSVSSAIIHVSAQQANSPNSGLGLEKSFQLNASTKLYTVAFTVTQTEPNSKIGFFVGNAIDTVTITQIILQKSSIELDRPKFHADLMKDYLIDMKSYLKDTLGVRAMIGIGDHWDNALLAVSSQTLDYIDDHAYFDHPTFPGSSFDYDNFNQTSLSAIANPNISIVHHATAAWIATNPEVPFTVSEWSHSFPNPYAYETPVLVAQAAKDNDWDALYKFQWANSTAELDEYNYLHSWFTDNANPQQLLLCSFGSKIFLGNGVYTNPGVYQVKNETGSWVNGRYYWGNSPILMKRTP